MLFKFVYKMYHYFLSHSTNVFLVKEKRKLHSLSQRFSPKLDPYLKLWKQCDKTSTMARTLSSFQHLDPHFHLINIALGKIPERKMATHFSTLTWKFHGQRNINAEVHSPREVARARHDSSIKTAAEMAQSVRPISFQSFYFFNLNSTSIWYIIVSLSKRK